MEGFRQGSYIIILCIYEPSGCRVKNELEEGQSKKQGDKLLQLSSQEMMVAWAKLMVGEGGEKQTHWEHFLEVDL